MALCCGQRRVQSSARRAHCGRRPLDWGYYPSRAARWRAAREGAKSNGDCGARCVPPLCIVLGRR